MTVEGFQIKNLIKGITQEFWGLMEMESRSMSQLEWKACPEKKRIRVLFGGKLALFRGSLLIVGGHYSGETNKQKANA